jgi:hypothetical protein
MDALLSFLQTPALYSFLGGAVAWGIINIGLSWWRRPIIEAELVPHAGCYVSGRGEYEDQGGKVSIPLKYLRFRVKNIGRSSIRDCSGYITFISKDERGQRIEDKREVLRLGWSHHPGESRNIPRGAFFHMDIAGLGIHQGKGSLIMGKIPSSLEGLFDKGGTFEFKVMIAADNATPFERSVRFEFDPSKGDLIGKYDDQSDIRP